MDEEYKLFLQYRNAALSYAIQYHDGLVVSEKEIFAQAERFFDFIAGEEPKKKRAKVIKLVKKI